MWPAEICTITNRMFHQALGSALLRQQRLDGLPDERADGFDAPGRLEHPYALRLGGGYGGKPQVHALEKGAVGFLHAIAQRFVERQLHEPLARGTLRHIQKPSLPGEPARYTDFQRDVE